MLPLIKQICPRSPVFFLITSNRNTLSFLKRGCINRAATVHSVYRRYTALCGSTSSHWTSSIHFLTALILVKRYIGNNFYLWKHYLMSPIQIRIFKIKCKTSKEFLTLGLLRKYLRALGKGKRYEVDRLTVQEKQLCFRN